MPLPASLYTLVHSNKYKPAPPKAKIPRRDALIVAQKGGAALNQDKIWQNVVCIGDQHGIATVFGVGLHGRVFGRGLHIPRFLVVSLYLPKRASSHTLKVHVDCASRKQLSP